MRALLTNDDGIDAYGLALLTELVGHFCDEIVIVAPANNRSGASQSISLQDELIFHKIAPNRYTCSGTPADCVLMAMNLLFKDNPPDIVFSGINHGMNAADDVGYSGTIGAAREATIFGVRAIALSQRRGVSTEDFEPARSSGRGVIAHALAQPWTPRTVLNVNFPSSRLGAVKGVRVGQLDRHKLADSILSTSPPDGYKIGPMHMRQKTDAHSDRAFLDQGYASMTPILVDTTDFQQLSTLRPTDF